MDIEKIIKKHAGERLYPIGFTFFMYGMNSMETEIYTVKDHLITFNSGGEVVKFEYLVVYNYCGQPAKARVCQTSIDRATNRQDSENLIPTQSPALYMQKFGRAKRPI